MTHVFKDHLEANTLSAEEEQAKIDQAVELLAQVILSQNKKSFCTTDNADKRALVNDTFPTNFAGHKGDTRHTSIFFNYNLLINKTTIALEKKVSATIKQHLLKNPKSQA
jgi:hypothetical protein